MNKFSAGKCSMSVNDAHLDWDQDTKRRAKRCAGGCGKLTKGLATIESPHEVDVTLPYCISCAVGKVTRLGLGAAPKFLKRLGGNCAH